MAVQAQSDVEQLHQLGYAQELLRRMSGFSNFAVSFTIISSWPSPLNAGTDFNSRLSIVAVYAVVLFLHGLLNTFGVRLVALLNDISVWWHIAGVTIIVALSDALLLPLLPP